MRQQPIGPYIADFVCRDIQLVIEVDGGQHAANPRDAVRDQWLVEHHYRVLRFWNSEVLENIEGVWDTIFAAGGLDACVARIATGMNLTNTERMKRNGH